VVASDLLRQELRLDSLIWHSIPIYQDLVYMPIFRSDVCIMVDPLYVGHLGAAFLAAMKSRLCFRKLFFSVTLGPIKVTL